MSDHLIIEAYKIVVYFRNGATAIYRILDKERAFEAVASLQKQALIKQYAEVVYGAKQQRSAVVNLEEVLHIEAKEIDA